MIKVKIILFISVLIISIFTPLGKAEESNDNVLFNKISQSIILLEFSIPKDPQFLEYLEKYLQIKSEKNEIEAIKGLFDSIFLKDNERVYNTEEAKQFITKTITVFMKIAGQQIANHISENHSYLLKYVDHTDLDLKRELLKGNNSALIKRDFELKIKRNNNQNKYELGRYESYGYQHFDPKQSFTKGIYYYNGNISLNSAPLNQNLILIDQTLSDITSLDKIPIALDLAEVIFSKYPNLSNAFFDILEEKVTDLNIKNKLYEKILLILNTQTDVLSFLDPYKKSLSDRLSIDQKIEWAFRFLSSQTFFNWKHKNQLNYLDKIHDKIIEITNKQDPEKYRGLIVKLIETYSKYLAHNFERHMKFEIVGQTKEQLSYLLRRLLERASHLSASEADKLLFRDLFTKDSNRAHYFKGLFSDADKETTLKFDLVKEARIGNRFLLNLLVEPSSEVVNHPTKNFFTSERTLDLIINASKNSNGKYDLEFLSKMIIDFYGAHSILYSHAELQMREKQYLLVQKLGGEHFINTILPFIRDNFPREKAQELYVKLIEIIGDHGKNNSVDSRNSYFDLIDIAKRNAILIDSNSSHSCKSLFN